jgi:hypothetical protein
MRVAQGLAHGDQPGAQIHPFGLQADASRSGLPAVIARDPGSEARRRESASSLHTVSRSGEARTPRRPDLAKLT